MSRHIEPIQRRISYVHLCKNTNFIYSTPQVPKQRILKCLWNEIFSHNFLLH